MKNEKILQGNIAWELISNDKFSRDAPGSKTGTDIGKGFYLLWFYTLLESVKEITANRNGIICTVPGEGFVFHHLLYKFNGVQVKVSIDTGKYLNELYNLKKVILNEYKGYDLAEKSSQVLTTLGITHALFYLSNKEHAFYEGLKETACDPGLSQDNLSSSLEILLKKNGMNKSDLSALASGDSGISDHPGEAGITER